MEHRRHGTNWRCFSDGLLGLRDDEGRSTPPSKGTDFPASPISDDSGRAHATTSGMSAVARRVFAVGKRGPAPVETKTSLCQDVGIGLVSIFRARWAAAFLNWGGTVPPVADASRAGGKPARLGAMPRMPVATLVPGLSPSPDQRPGLFRGPLLGPAKTIGGGKLDKTQHRLRIP